MESRLEAQPKQMDAIPEQGRQAAEAINAFLGECMDGFGLPTALDAAVRHGLLSGGKRMRPVLTLQSAVAAGGTWEQALPAAAAVEMIHAFSLIHDDLPALDDDDLRRGEPTVHVAHGEATAILAGDALMALAFQVLSERCGDAAVAGRLTAELATGTTAMIVGQIHDTLGGLPDSMPEAERVRLIHEKKTGALIRASCRMGVLSVVAPTGAGAETLAAITDYADAIGLMFQIVDDLMDIEQTAEHVGKRTSKDHERGKLTFPGVHGAEEARAEIRSLLVAARSSTERLGPGAGPLADLAEYLSTRTR